MRDRGHLLKQIRDLRLDRRGATLTALLNAVLAPTLGGVRDNDDERRPVTCLIRMAFRQLVRRWSDGIQRHACHPRRDMHPQLLFLDSPR